MSILIALLIKLTKRKTRRLQIEHLSKTLSLTYSYRNIILLIQVITCISVKTNSEITRFNFLNRKKIINICIINIHSAYFIFCLKQFDVWWCHLLSHPSDWFIVYKFNWKYICLCLWWGRGRGLLIFQPTVSRWFKCSSTRGSISSDVTGKRKKY